MRDRFFEVFVKALGEATFREDVPQSSIDRYSGVLPDRLLEYWKHEGWSAYANGLFWTVDPSKYEALVEAWLSDSPYEAVDKYHIIARTGFGELHAWGETTNRDITISCPLNALIGIDKTIRSKADDGNLEMGVFFMVKDKDTLDLSDQSNKPLFKRAFKKLGHLASDEVYGFEHALVAGGEKGLANLSRQNLFVHLAMLRELAAPSTPFLNFDVPDS